MTTTTHSIRRWLPRLAALAAAFVGLVNIASALTPNMRWRGHALLDFEPVEAMKLFHALALPAGLALLLVAPYLVKRRHRAFQAALILMVALGIFDLLKGLDFEETAITWGVAAVLLAGRKAFQVRHDPITLRSALWRVPLLGALAVWRWPRLPPGPPRAIRRGRRCGPRRPICSSGKRARSASTATSPSFPSAST